MSTELPPNERPPEPHAARPQSQGLPGAVIGGLVLIGLGAFFLLQNLNIMPDIDFDFNWWALFILIPIFAVANSAWQTYQANGERVNREVRSKMVGAAILSLVFLTLMFEWNWGQIWPLFLIIGGLGILLNKSE
jgi:hypothetical protein